MGFENPISGFMIFSGYREGFFMSGLNFIFNCYRHGLDLASAREVVAPLGIIVNQSNAGNPSFLVTTTQDLAEAFKAANQDWKVYPEVKYQRPRPHRLKILKPTSES
jgi:hypothetical protein